MKDIKDKKIIAISLGLIVLGIGAYFYSTKGGLNFTSAKQIDEIKIKAEKFINQELVQPGTNATIKSIVKENGMYKVVVSVNGQEIPAYISGDGKNFFPKVISMEKANQKEVSKTDKPSVELFVMSYCPYGLQAEKGILPAINLLGSKIDFKLKFVDYIMHGDKEIDENLRQYCIQKSAPAKLNEYLDCFTKQDNASACLASAKIDSSSLAVCVSQTDAQFKVKAKAADKNQWRTPSFPPFDVDQADNTKYGVQGSPTLIINGTVVSPARDPQSFLASICSAFNNAPGECQQKLSTDAPSPGFGEGTSASSNAAQCES